ncbi:hypothetical protein [Corynebacterium heidelbergense]|uniref:J domain-containing protein n=1 Tax=Corynebacterium heidelbergense TaxID=2055947 RepID=A0A364VAB5_9CORY|nr:hypothetical protein [Corynebacterium heidelbergense]RAV33613.1 hypothetical protein CWC39_07505 [Corynebacterium heidelbergense]WCZ35761.1 hypothetical protein CHEID_00910 [Corynebacterium heidelbergense]
MKFDLYESLQLNRDTPPADIERVLQARLNDLKNSGQPDNSPQVDEVRTAKSILADPYKRDSYDAALADSSTNVDIQWIKNLASTDLSRSNPMPFGAPQSSQNPSVEINMSNIGVKEDRHPSQSLMWTIGYGIILLPWLYLLFRLVALGLNSYDRRMSDVYSAGFFAAAHTAAMLVFLNLLWNIRKLMGRRAK